jgi:DNA-binding transcriptional regulator YbjK
MSTLFKDSIVYAEYGETIAVGDMLYMSQGTGADSARTVGQLYKLEIANPDRNVFYGIAKEAGIAR